jgi:hypothetical protein
MSRSDALLKRAIVSVTGKSVDADTAGYEPVELDVREG